MTNLITRITTLKRGDQSNYAAQDPESSKQKIERGKKSKYETHT